MKFVAVSETFDLQQTILEAEIEEVSDYEIATEGFFATVWNAIKKAVMAVFNFIAKIFKAIINGIKSLFGIKSDSSDSEDDGPKYKCTVCTYWGEEGIKPTKAAVSKLKSTLEQIFMFEAYVKDDEKATKAKIDEFMNKYSELIDYETQEVDMTATYKLVKRAKGGQAGAQAIADDIKMGLTGLDAAIKRLKDAKNDDIAKGKEITDKDIKKEYSGFVNTKLKMFKNIQKDISAMAKVVFAMVKDLKKERDAKAKADAEKAKQKTEKAAKQKAEKDAEKQDSED